MWIKSTDKNPNPTMYNSHYEIMVLRLLASILYPIARKLCRL